MGLRLLLGLPHHHLGGAEVVVEEGAVGVAARCLPLLWPKAAPPGGVEAGVGQELVEGKGSLLMRRWGPSSAVGLLPGPLASEEGARGLGLG